MTIKNISFTIIALFVIALSAYTTLAAGTEKKEDAIEKVSEVKASEVKESAPTKTAVATLAGGCFWCLEAAFDKIDGVTKTISGYTGGHTDNPTYHQIGSGKTGHYEALQVTYDPKKISYLDILTAFWKNIDPTDGTGQFCDKGTQYRSAIFYKDEVQKRLADASLMKLQTEKFKSKKIATKILKLSKFYPAEEYHQNYHIKNPIRYKIYRTGCGRARRLKEIWN